MTVEVMELAASSVFLLFLTGLLSIALQKSQGVMVTVCMLLAAAASAIAAIAGFQAVSSGEVSRAVLLIGLPDLPFHVRIDPLAGFFMAMVGLLSFFVSIYSIGYVRGIAGVRPVTRLAVFYCLFLAGMLMVILADDALFFLV